MPINQETDDTSDQEDFDEEYTYQPPTLEEKIQAAINSGENPGVAELLHHLDNEDTDSFLKKLDSNQNLAKEHLSEKEEDLLLIKAIRWGNTICALRLIELGANVNAEISIPRMSVLLEAIKDENFQISKSLLDHGADYSPETVGDYSFILSAKYSKTNNFLTEKEYIDLINQIRSGVNPIPNKINRDKNIIHVFGQGWIDVDESD